MQSIVAAAVSIVISTSLLGATAPANVKQPWEWTAQERADARHDPAKRLERLRGDDAERRMMRVPNNSGPRVADVIDGAKHPELYFPTELFEYLVRYSFVTLPEVYPHIVHDRTTDLFRNPVDWKRFVSIVSDYVKFLKQEQAAASALDKPAVTALQSSKCAAEARALREARRTFGRTRFDRMLYETVPGGMKTSFSMDTDFETSIRSALQREERCQ